jgi:AcrR family transcriptional regulator
VNTTGRPGVAAVTSPASRAERKRNELRQDIIDTAFACFADDGYHATGIADIAARMGIGHGTFYRYFQNKRDIIGHVLDHVLARITQALAAENAPEAATTLQEYRDQSGRIADAFIELLLDDPRVARIVLFEATSVDPELTERFLDFLDAAAALNAAYLAHGVELGYLRADLDVEYTARAINGMIIAAALNGIRDPKPQTQQRFANAVRQLMYDGIAATP